MKLTKEKLEQLIMEVWKKSSLDALKAKKPGYAFTTPRRKFSDEPLVDEWGDLVDEKGEEVWEPIFPEEDATPEMLRARAAQMARAGMKPDHVRKLSDVGAGNLEDLQPFELADVSMDEPLEGRYSPELEKLAASKKKIKSAYDEIYNSRELRMYQIELSNRMYHPGTQDYKDNFYEADQDLTALEKRVAKKYGLTQDEIDSLDSMLETPKNVY